MDRLYANYESEITVASEIVRLVYLFRRLIVVADVDYN